MNKKVLKTMIALVIVFLLACYILKIFFPEQFVLSVENETIIAIGNYIDSNEWAYYLFGIFTSILTYWLYLCAVCRKWYLNWWQCLIVLGVIGISIGLSFIDITIYSAFSYTSFVFIPFVFKANIKEVAITYTVHTFAQHISLSIRNLPLLIATINSLNIFLLSMDMYLWLFLFYLYFNYKRNI